MTRSFSHAECDALFAAVLVDDVVDAHTALPDRIELDFASAQLDECFGLCRQLWLTGVDRDELVELNDRLWRDGDLDAADRQRFKYARAKFKHLRFAFALYGVGHRYPPVFDWMTTAMGHMQDAFKNGRRGAVNREAVLGRLFLSAGPQALLKREAARFAVCSAADFRAYVLKQAAILRTVLARDAVTGAQFHATRKIISRQVSFYDTLRTLEPSEQAFSMSRSLAAINGLMGEMHDRLVEERVAGIRDYHHEAFELPGAIADRLSALVARYPA